MTASGAGSAAVRWVGATRRLLTGTRARKVPAEPRPRAMSVRSSRPANLHNLAMPMRRGEEVWAEAMVRAHLGLEVKHHDDGSEDGMYDLRIILPDDSHAAAEVTSCADPDSIETWKLMNGDDEVWVFPELRGGWFVTVHPSARVQKLKKQLPMFLGRFERAGITQAGSWRTPEWVESSCENLGVTTAHQSGTDRPGSVYLTIELPSERSGGAVPSHGDSIAEWIGTFLYEPRQQDVLDKLHRSGTAQRHAFVFLPSFTLAPWPVPYLLMSDSVPLPRIAPGLPPEVTHIWVTGKWNTATGVRWSPESGWEHFSKKPRTQVS